jgi:hypothetical protein
MTLCSLSFPGLIYPRFIQFKTLIMSKSVTIKLPKYIGVTALLAGTLAISSSAQAATLYSQANIITNPGAGFGGADVSAIAPGANTFGFGAIEGSNRLADDFTVPAGGWLVDSVSVLAYVTGTYSSPPSSPFTGISMNIWSGTPGSGGTVISSSSSLLSTNWSGIYRTNTGSTNFTNDQRPVMNVVASFPSLSLGQGTYWVDWALTIDRGSSFSWVPPVMTASGNLVAGNSLQFTVASGVWASNTDRVINQVDLPFAINGTAVNGVAVPEPSAVPAVMVFGGFLLARRAVRRRLTNTEAPISFKD